MVEGLEMICFKTISSVKDARFSYIEAVRKAKQGDLGGTRECIKAGQEMFLAGHEAHFELTQKETQGEQVSGPVILVHAEDQLMNVEGFKIIAKGVITSHERVAGLEKKLEDHQFRHRILPIGIKQEQ